MEYLSMSTRNNLGVFFFIDTLSATEAGDFARTVEALGYRALWYPEAVGRNSMVTGAWLLAQTASLTVASGIANIFARDAQASASARLALNEMSGGRFLMGLGVSHAGLVEDVRGHSFQKPLQRMRDYVERMKSAIYQSPMPENNNELVIAALGPKMTALAGELSDGAHSYNVTPEHTAKAREILGPEKKLYVEQKVLLETDPSKARAVARESLAPYLSMINYQKNWARLGFTDSDWEQPSDKLLDAMVAWGDESALRKRIEEHFEAGADQVCIQPLTDPGEVLRLLAPRGSASENDPLERGTIRR